MTKVNVTSKTRCNWKTPLRSSALALLLLGGVAGQVLAERPGVAELGKSLTPLGAERAGNKDNSIPEWTGGITSPPSGYEKGKFHIDPFDADKVQFEINASNVEKYRDRLTEGQQAILQKYPDFTYRVYPTRRSASFPQYIYDASIRNASTAQLANDGNTVANGAVGVPFPIPHNGLEAIWNHLLRFRGEAALRHVAQAPVSASGSYTIGRSIEDFYIPYSAPNATIDGLHNNLIYLKQYLQTPPQFAGQIVLAHETLDKVTESRSAWLYLPGLRRVRRAPFISYDGPSATSDGLRTFDQFDMYNGAPDRYDWELKGKREMYVPYNSYKLYTDKLKYKDIIQPYHPNPEHLRYELHRVWVVDAKLKEGARHIYSRRTFYFDEDSWQILWSDNYDSDGVLWRSSEAHAMNFYEVPVVWTAAEVHYDLQSGRYLVMGLSNEQKPHDFTVTRTPTDYSPSSLRLEGMR